MNPVCFPARTAWVLLVHFTGAHRVATLDVVTESNQVRVTARAATRIPRQRIIRPVPSHAQPARGPIQAIVLVRLAPKLPRQVFERRLRALPAVRSAVYVAGDVDCEIRLACLDLADLELVLVRLRGLRDVAVVSTGLVLREVEGLGQPALTRRDWTRAPRPREVRSAQSA
jgi:hypothetical protein